MTTAETFSPIQHEPITMEEENVVMDQYNATRENPQDFVETSIEEKKLAGIT
jgi:hypothetical protein